MEHNYSHHGMAHYGAFAFITPDVVILIAFFAKGGIGGRGQRLVALHNEAVGADVCSANRRNSYLASSAPVSNVNVCQWNSRGSEPWHFFLLSLGQGRMTLNHRKKEWDSERDTGC